jgi:outer membrane protein OmpA-like peptidoglycan-associated protein
MLPAAPPLRRAAQYAGLLCAVLLSAAVPFAPSARAAVNCSEVQAAASGEEWTVRFATGSAALDETARRQVARAADRIRGRFASEVCLIGRASRVGNADANLRLSRQRIAAVQAELRRRGVAADVLGSRAEGDARSGALARSNESGERSVQIVLVR